jgi:3-phenylpropionate/trans-cinnamate dioxygenase ferredoxin reductase component
MDQTFVVVGSGLAAGKAVEELRAEGFSGAVVVYGDEHHLPYERPPLSKGFLLDADPLDVVFVHDPDWYEQRDVDLRLGTAVTAIDLAAHEVVTATGRQRYDKLLLATGATPRRLAMADESGAPVAYLRTIEDSQRLKATFREGLRVAIIGGGWIGLEVAAAARGAGCAVTVLESLDLPLLRVLGPEVAGTFADLHRDHGVDLRTSVQVAAVEAKDGGAVVRLADGATVEADLLVVGVGVSPNDALARDAGLATDNGVLVDERLRTSDPDVFAAGDVANHQHPRLGRRIRVEHWDTAIEQGKTAARNMLGLDVSYDRLPYFFSDQYDLGMEYVGSVGPEGYDDVLVSPGAEAGAFTAYWLRQGIVQAAMQVNSWDESDGLWTAVGKDLSPDRAR